MDHFIGIDIGTTHCKAILADQDGRVIASAKRSYPTDHPAPGYHVQDGDIIFDAVVAVLKEVLGSSTSEDLRAICFSAAMHSVLAVGSTGAPLTAAITWADMRSDAYAARLRDTEPGRRIYTATGTPVHAMSPLCKIAWMRDEWPSVFAAAAKFVSIKEYVAFRLTGEWVVDYSIASATGLFNVHRCDWEPEALAFAGIDAGRLSTPVLPTYQYKKFHDNLVVDLGLKENVRLVTGGSDGCLANIGSGAIGDAHPAMTIGTSGAMRCLVRNGQADKSGRLFHYRFDDEFFLSGGAINNGGILMQWFINTFCDPGADFKQSLDQLFIAASSIAPGSEGLVFLPYVNGERAPVWDASATGVFAGIRSIHNRAHFFRAVLEGVGFALRQVMEAMEGGGRAISMIRCGGGFIESGLWVQIIADILQKPLQISRQADQSALGAVFVAMRAVDRIANYGEAAELVAGEGMVNPDISLSEVYTHNYSIYKTLYK